MSNEIMSEIERSAIFYGLLMGSCDSVKTIADKQSKDSAFLVKVVQTLDINNALKETLVNYLENNAKLTDTLKTFAEMLTNKADSTEKRYRKGAQSTMSVPSFDNMVKIFDAVAKEERESATLRIPLDETV